MRVNLSVILATAIAIGAAGWILSGQVADQPATAAVDGPLAPQATTAPQPPRVRVLTSQARDYVAVVRASGQTLAKRSVEIRAETAGRVASVGAPRGSMVDAGQLIVQLDEADRRAQLERAKARVQHRRIEYDAARQLAAKGYQAETKRAQALADLEEARADQAHIQVDLERTRIVAPFRAVLDRRPMEVGDYLQVGDPVATLVELDPMRAVANIPEQEAPALVEGMPATVRLSSGADFPAVVTYTAAAADSATRTFRIEAEFANPEGRIGEGMTAELQIPLPATRAHHVSPAVFLLDDQGKIGVMTVDSGDVARFRRIAVLGSDDRGAWITGLPETARIVTVGQQLVTDGQAVTPVEVGAGAPQS
ncbi:hemolysin D [Thalassobaculum fulvum]|uniref:Hemolysin D n=1 Tax=Thalassobaculum fulvum TaxID=1633335 RepID=A0A918XXA8_9PROT|nr:efflux RND transporter periplasmic adaptor subunit [Thalassobaculum fulvum]GHD61135.1 hemolysin D [Thalassobaculum fulvum]